MTLVRLAPAGPRLERNRAWTVGASLLLHAVAFAILIAIAARRPPMEDSGGAPSYELVFDDGRAAPQSALPPAQPADIPVPDDALPGPPAPAPTSAPAPDGVPSQLPEAAQAVSPPLAAQSPSPAQPPLPAPATASASPPQPATAAAPALAFAPEAVPAEPPPPTPTEIIPAPAPPPTVRLETPSAPEPQQQEAMIMPQPPPPLPAPPAPPRPRPPPRPTPGTLANPMDLSFGPSSPRPAPAARGSVASRAIDLSPGAPRQGPNRLDPYAEIRAANASADWNRGLMAYWLRHRYYPRQAAESHEDGTVVIELTVNRSGRVESVEVKSRSGSQWLDMAAVGTFRNGQLPPFTPEMTEDRITFTVPINYILLR